MAANTATPMEKEQDPADPWIIARNQYIADLDDDERKLFDHATLENLLQASAEEQSTHQKQSQSRAILGRLKPFLSAIEDFGTAFDVISNTYSIVLAPLWGALRVVLQLAQKFNKIFDRIVEILERIGYILPRFRDYERVFGRHSRVIAALTTAYMDIVTFCGEIKSFIRSIQRSRIKSFTKLFGPLDHHLTDALARFRMHREDVELEVEACHMIESAKHYEIELHNRELAALERKSQLRKYLRNLLSPIDYCEKQRKVQKARHRGTGQWLFQEEDYGAWKASSQSAVLSVFGIPGCGKTILASCVIDELQEEVDRVVVAYHYCDYKDVRSLDPVTIVGTLINGLIDDTEITDELSALIENAFKEGRRSPDENEILQLLDLALNSHLDSTIYIVVDGVDEVNEASRKVLFRFLEHVTKCQHSTIKLGITSRSDFTSMGIILPPRLRKFRVHVKAASVSSDIDIFVRHTVQSFIMSRDLVIRETSLKDEIVEKLTQGAKGMFLWVTFQMDSLCECDSDAAIRETLSNLPRDLTETYQRLLNKIRHPQRQALVRRMMQWIVCARRPLRIDELLEAVAFTIEDDHWDHSKIPVDPLRLIRASGNLMLVDEEDQSVQLAHYTVQQFLLSTAPEEINPISFRFQFNREEAERYVGETCVIYISFNDFETQISRYKNRTRAHMEVIEKALLGSESIVHGGVIESTVSTLSRLLRPRFNYQPSNIDFSRYIPQNPHGLRSKYELLGYVITEWLYHTTNLSETAQDEENSRTPHASEIWGRFQNLVFRKQLLFNLRPWEQSKNDEPALPHLPLVCWAVRNGHVALLKAVNESTSVPLSAYFDRAAKWFGSKNKSYISGETKRITEISNILLPDLQQMSDSPTSCALFFFISEACTRGDTQIIDLYISALAESKEGHGDSNVRSTLQLNSEYLMIEAAANAQDKICSLLIPYCEFQAVTVHNGRPCGALKRAALLGHTEVVSVLKPVAGCPEIDREPLLQGLWAQFEAKMMIDAARAGNLSVVTTLRSVCAPDTPLPDDGEAEDAPPPDLSDVVVGERALMQAINCGHKEVVIHLLDCGVSVNNPLPWRLFDIDQGHSQDSILSIARTVQMGCFGLHLAVARNDQAMVKLLLDGDADPELGVYFFEKEMYIKCKWTSPLAHASANGNIEIAQDLLEYGANIESQYISCTTWEGLRFRYTTPLIQAAGSGHMSMMEYLLSAGANIDNYDYAGNTPLSAAAAGDHIEAATLLIQKGATLISETRQEPIPLVSPVVEAIRYGSVEMLQLLLDAGVNFKTSIQSKMPLIIAVADGKVETVELLLKYGADVNGGENVRKLQGWPSIPLCRAIRLDDIPMVELLLRFGADPFCVAGWGRSETTPLKTAQEYAQTTAAKLVLEYVEGLESQLSELTDTESTASILARVAEQDLNLENSCGSLIDDSIILDGA